MNDRRGEKIGWIGGWLGSFLWLAILSVVWLAQGKIAFGLAGLGLFGAALALTFFLVPWRRPETKYWKLFLPGFLMLAGSAGFAISALGGIRAVGLDWTALVALGPIFIVFPVMGNRSWKDDPGGDRPSHPQPLP